jgi:hypothetical protein
MKHLLSWVLFIYLYGNPACSANGPFWAAENEVGGGGGLALLIANLTFYRPNL